MSTATAPTLLVAASCQEGDMPKEHAMLLSVFLLFKFLSKDLIIAALTAYFIRGIVVLSATLLPSMKCFLTKECNYEEVVSRTQLIHSIFVALALRIAVPRGSKNRFFNCAFLRYPVSLALLVIIMNWLQATQGGQPALLYVALICLVAIHCLWNGERKQDGTNQLMGKVWDWDMYGTKQKKFDAWVLQTANEHGDRGDDDATLLDDGGDGPKDGSSGPESSEDSDGDIMPLGQRAVQLLAIRANFPICGINGYDGYGGQRIYFLPKGDVQEEGMADLVPVGPGDIFTAYGYFILEVFYFTTTASDEGLSMADLPIKDGWDVCDGDEIEEYTQTICEGPGRRLEITYLVIPNAIETNVEVTLKLKDLGSRSRAVYGNIKASGTGFGNKSVHLLSRERRRSLSFLSGSSSILPLSPSVIAVPCCRQLKLHIEVDLTVITAYDGQEEEEKNLKFSLEFTNGNRSQEREVDGDGVEVNITCDPEV